MEAIQRLARRYLQRQASADPDLQWGAEQIEVALSTLKDVVDVWDLKRPREGALSQQFPALGKATRLIRNNISGQLDDIKRLALALASGRRVAGAGMRLNPNVRSRVNRELNRVGMGGNKSFEEASHGYRAAVEALGSFDILIDDFANSFKLNTQATGRMSLDLAFVNPDPQGDPIQISNALLVLSWYRRETGKFEVTGYVS